MPEERPENGVRSAELIAALSLATDLGSGQPMEHALRRCVLAVRLGETLGLGQDELTTVYYLALLQYIGCTTDAHLVAAVFGDETVTGDWYARIATAQPPEVFAAMLRHLGEGSPPLRRARAVATAFANLPKMSEVPIAHCEVGQRLADRLGFGADLQRALGQVFERWDGKGQPGAARGEAIARSVRIVRFAQDAETFHRLGGVEAAIATARQRAGAAHDPRIVECFCREAEHLLAGIEADSSWDLVLATEPGTPVYLSESQLDISLQALADFADLKSPSLAGHSRGVAELAAEAACRCRLPEADVVAIRRAGWLHDLGRVGITAAIWNKAGTLTSGEWERVRLHPYYTERILARPRAMARLGGLASLHHERLDGSGYHRGSRAAALPITARILAAADVYHALTEHRPHRPARPPEAAADVLRSEVRSGRLDDETARAVLLAAGHRAQRVRHDWPAGLSEREVEVMRLVARGLSNRQMAEELVISKETVNNHVRHIYDKVGVSTRAAAVLFAMQHDLLGSLGPLDK